MPTVLRIGNLRFYIYFNDHKPAHVHVIKNNSEAKFKIETGECISSIGFNKKSVNEISKTVLKHKSVMMEAWKEFGNEE